MRRLIYSQLPTSRRAEIDVSGLPPAFPCEQRAGTCPGPSFHNERAFHRTSFAPETTLTRWRRTRSISNESSRS